MAIKEFNPKNYDYLWTDTDVNFIFTSCYLFKEFKMADIVLIYNWREKGLKFFLSKKSRRELSDLGVHFYQERFPIWKKEMLKNIALGKKLVKLTKENKNKVGKMTSSQIRTNFLARVNLFQALGGNYFYTEFFVLDRVEELVKKYPLKYKLMIKNLDEMAKIKLEAREVLNNFYNYNEIFKPYIDELSRRIKRNDLPWLSFEEILRVSVGKKVTISNRARTDWVLAKKNSWKIIQEDAAEQIAKSFDEYFFNVNVKIIKGSVANPGFHRGHVKIIRTIFSNNISQEIKKVKRGDVLVAATTGPEIMIAIKNCGAIVTDEGGITSHAAIISRELDKPCIIGTKIATKVLKDGDLVEVDCKKGIVKIIK